jgi:hypothetical protein
MGAVDHRLKSILEWIPRHSKLLLKRALFVCSTDAVSACSMMVIHGGRGSTQQTLSSSCTAHRHCLQVRPTLCLTGAYLDHHLPSKPP